MSLFYLSVYSVKVAMKLSNLIFTPEKTYYYLASIVFLVNFQTV